MSQFKNGYSTLIVTSAVFLKKIGSLLGSRIEAFRPRLPCCSKCQ